MAYSPLVLALLHRIIEPHVVDLSDQNLVDFGSEHGGSVGLAGGVCKTISGSATQKRQRSLILMGVDSLLCRI